MQAVGNSVPPSGFFRRLLCAGLLAGSGVLLVGSLVVTVYNLRYSYRRITELVGPAAWASPNLAESELPQWVRPFMVDLSVVTPGLVVFTSACMFSAALLLLAGRASDRRLASPHYPFPPTYKSYYVQMGLLGTIVGFVIAFSHIDPHAERQSIVLLEALGTALWSTLTAIALAYAVCPGVEVAYQAIARRSAPIATVSALDRLKRSTVEAADSLARLTQSARAADAALGAQALESRIGRLEGTAQTTTAEVRELALAVRQLQSTLETFEGRSRQIETRTQLAEQKIEDLARQLRELSRTVESGAIEETSRRLGGVERRLASLLDTLRKAAD